MTLRRGSAVVVVLGAIVFGVVGGSGRSVAAAPSLQGWWKVGLPIADTGIGGLGNLKDPQAADVPDGGLLVQGGPTVAQPAAYAALSFDLGTAAVSGPLRLVPAPTTVSVPGSKLIACSLNDASFKPADGGAIADAPPYSCSSAVPATVDGSGTYVFDIAGLRRGDSLAVAIIPTSPTDRVVFSRPSANALPVTESPGDATPDASAQPSPDAALSTPGLDSSSTPVLTPSIGGLATVGDAPLNPSPVPASAGTSAPGVLPTAQPAAETHSSSSDYAPYLVAGLVVLAAVLWLGAGQAPE
ncbi:MAG: hypothetical protein JO086_14475 [Acidimicrobiia bacterium]|nr:hypothetical protein [Acidimicrobiia bacterium]